MPGPWSRTPTVPPATSTSTTSPAGLHLAALSSRLVTARSSRAGTPRTSVGCGDEPEADVVRVALGPLDGVGHEHVEAHVVLLGRRLAVARELDDVAHERRHLVELAVHVALELAAALVGQRSRPQQHLEVRAQARERRAQLVRRVGDELALGGDRLLERRQHGVEAGGEPAQLVAARHVDAAA